MQGKKKKKKKKKEPEPVSGKRVRRPVLHTVQQQQAARWPRPRERSAVKTALVALGAIPATELETPAAEFAADGVAAAVDSVTDSAVTDADAASQLLDFSCLPASDPFQSSGSLAPPPPLLALPTPNLGALKVACPVCGGMFKPKGGTHTHHRKHQDVEYGGDCRGSGLPIAADDLA